MGIDSPRSNASEDRWATGETIAFTACFVARLPVANQRLFDCGPDLAQVRRRKCRVVDGDIDIADRVGASIAGSARSPASHHDRSVVGDPSHSLGDSGRHTHEQRVAGPA